MKLPKGFQFLAHKPYPFQEEAFVFGITRTNAGLLLPMGSGKTRVAIDIARYRLQTGDVKNVLVVCPATILYNWENEIRLYSEYKSLVVPKGAARAHSITHNKNYPFLIMNYESLLPLLQALRLVTKVKTGKGTKILFTNNLSASKQLFDMVIFDESARYLKTYDTDRTIASIVLADKARHKLILTGTPIANKPIEIWPQFRALDGGKTFGTNFFRFKNEFFYVDKRDPFKRPHLKKQFVPRLTNGIYSICIRKQKEEILKDLPDKIFTSIYVKPTEDLLTAYDAVKKQILSEISTSQGSIVFQINNILTRLLRLQQITSGFISKNNRIFELQSQPKLDALVEEVESIVDAEESVIIWCRFIKSIEMISNRLNHKRIKNVTMSGQDKNKKARFEKWKSFQTDNSISAFTGQIDSGGIGIELFKLDSTVKKSQHMIFYENSWSLDTRMQAIERIHRIGQKSSCRYIDLIVKNTIDEKILDTIQQNKQIADMILQEGVANFIK